MYFKVDEIRKVVDSELGFVADVPYIQSEAKVSSLKSWPQIYDQFTVIYYHMGM